MTLNRFDSLADIIRIRSGIDSLASTLIFGLTAESGYK